MYGGLLLMVGCASPKMEKELDKKVSLEEKINSQADLNAESDKVIQADTQLTDAQKQQLIQLRNQTRTDAHKYYTESLRLRAVLIKDLLSANYNRAEVFLIKNKIKKSEEKRISILLDAIEKSNAILGRQAEKHEFILREVYQ